MRLGAGDEPIDVLFRAFKIAGPKEHFNGPAQGTGKCYRMIHACSVIDGLARAFYRLGRMALQPQGRCEGDTRQL